MIGMKATLQNEKSAKPLREGWMKCAKEQVRTPSSPGALVAGVLSLDISLVGDVNPCCQAFQPKQNMKQRKQTHRRRQSAGCCWV